MEPYSLTAAAFQRRVSNMSYGQRNAEPQNAAKTEIFLFVSCCNCVERSDDHNSDIQKLNETLTLDSTPTAVVASGVLRWKRPWKNQFLSVCGCKEYVRAREWFLHVTIHKDLSERFLR